MLIMPPAEQRQTAPRRLSLRERRLLGGVGLAVAALIVAVVVSFATSGPTSGHGCLRVTYAGPVGAQQITSCGASARALCASVGTATGPTGPAVAPITAECRKLRFRVGP